MKIFPAVTVAALSTISLASLPQTLTAQSVVSAATPQPCATASIFVTPTVVPRGDSVSITGKFKNCSSRVKRYKLTFKLEGPDKFKQTVGPLTVSVATNKTYSRKVTIDVPSFAPTGTYGATVLVRSTDGTLLDTASASLVVTK